MELPTLVVVSGPAGSGKTTLAHGLARAIGCPVVCRDEIKEGMVHAVGSFEAARGDALSVRTLPLFFGTLRLLLEGGVTVVAEAAFQDKVWTPNLEPLTEVAIICIVHCHADADTARGRVRERAGSRVAHADREVVDDARYFDEFRRVAMAVPSIDVDTTAGYEPSIERVVAFVKGA